MTSIQTVNGHNHLLQLLISKNVKDVISQCELIELTVGQALMNPNEAVAYAYFPLSGIISWEKKISGCPYLLLSLIGSEGMLNINLNLNIDQTSCRAIVLKHGFAWRMSVEKFEVLMQKNSAFSSVLKNYTFVVMSQLMQYSVCNHFHLLECRLAKIFLMLQSRAKAYELIITHETLAQMLGVRRVGITKAASVLQRHNIIRYSRGRVSILNLPKLLQQSCVCYESDNAVYEKFLGTLN